MRDCLKNLQVRIIVRALICPSGYLPSESDNTVISRLVDSLTVRIQSARERSKHLNDSAHQTQVRWCWISEIEQEGRPHYHFVLRLNKDALSISTRIHTAVFELHGRVRWEFLSTIPMAWCISLTTLDATSLRMIQRSWTGTSV